MQPRPYQAEALKALTRAFEQHSSAILALPTGSGKTFVAVRWLVEHVLKKGEKVVWIAHRRELLDQARGAFARLSESLDPQPKITWYASGRGFDPSGDVVLASVASARDIPEIRPAFAVIDEAHHEPASSYQNVLERLAPKLKFGLTATPERLDQKPLNFETIAFQRTLMDLVREGWLARPKPVVPRTRMSFDVALRAGEVARDSLRLLDTPERNAFITEHWQQNRDQYGKTLVFALNRDHARQLVSSFEQLMPQPRVGIVLGDLKAEDRDETIRAFRSGELDVLINVEVFTEGFDCPDVQTVMLTRPTLSATLYLQMVGRGTRIAPGKNSFYLVDFEDQLGEFQNQMIRPWLLGNEVVQAEPEPRQREASLDLPPALATRQRYEPVSLSEISGYVVYRSGPVEEEGYFVHKDDEEIFLDVWNAVEGTSDQPNLELARHIPTLPQLHRVSRAQLIASLAALQDGEARYVPLFTRQLTTQILDFLSPAGLTKEDELELTRQLHSVWALGRYYDDELSDQLEWFPVFHLEKEAWEAATGAIDENRGLRGEERRRLLTDTYENVLSDTVASQHQWERFATHYTRSPDEAFLVLERSHGQATVAGESPATPLEPTDNDDSENERVVQETTSDESVAELARWRPRLKTVEDFHALGDEEKADARRTFGSAAILLTRLGALPSIEDMSDNDAN